jgi:NaMN:DMB phosphoribosyltransferase
LKIKPEKTRKTGKPPKPSFIAYQAVENFTTVEKATIHWIVISGLLTANPNCTKAG